MNLKIVSLLASACVLSLTTAAALSFNDPLSNLNDRNPIVPIRDPNQDGSSVHVVARSPFFGDNALSTVDSKKSASLPQRRGTNVKKLF